MLVKVAGGTGAGRKRPLRQMPARPWCCVRGHINPPYATRCLGDHCRETRP